MFPESSVSSGGGGEAEGGGEGGGGEGRGRGGGATAAALFPCLIYSPGKVNYKRFFHRNYPQPCEIAMGGPALYHDCQN